MADKNSTSLVAYGDYDDADVKTDRQDIDSESGNNFVKIKVGKTIIRFVPPPPGVKWRLMTHVHYVDVPGTGRIQFVCPRLTEKRLCPVCTQMFRLEKTGNEVDFEKAKKLRPKRRCYANVIVRGMEHDGVKIFGFGKQIEDALVGIREDADEGGNFVNPVTGFDIAIKRVGTGQFDTEYKVSGANKCRVCPLHSDTKQMNEWISEQGSLERYTKSPSDANIARMLRGEKAQRDGDADDDQRTVRPRRPSKSIDEEADISDADLLDEELV